MKKTLYLFCFVLINIYSCGDPCDDIDCGPNGNCIDGTCMCDTGYSGTNCEINVCDSVNCNNGTCDPMTGACSCNEGYEGQFCDTEIRAKYFGTYTGNLSACLEGLVDPEQVPQEFLTATAVVSADPDDINKVIIAQASALLNSQTLNVNPSAGVFILPVTSSTIDLEDLPFPVTITVTGDGVFNDENSFVINLNIIIPLFPAITCSITLTKV